jgi:hypothetical protein
MSARRIAVLADTHDRLPPALPGLLREADEIWHLGDVTAPRIIEVLRSVGCRVRVVRGNCDDCLEWPFADDFLCAGLRIRLEHIPPGVVPAGIDLLLHGHTHVPRDETIGGVRFLNPGTVGKPNRGAPPSFAWLTLAEGEPARWAIRRL